MQNKCMMILWNLMLLHVTNFGLTKEKKGVEDPKRDPQFKEKNVMCVTK